MCSASNWVASALRRLWETPVGAVIDQANPGVFREGEFMSKFVILASVVAVAAISAACAETGGQTNPGASLFTAPTSLTASSAGAEVSAPTARGGGGKPGGGGSTTGGSGSISLVMVNDVGTSGTSLGDTVTFNVSTTATTKPWVTVKCFQNGTLVSKESNGIFPTSLDQIFTLGPTGFWQGGAASCTATLENWDGYSKNGAITALGSMSFQAAG